MEETQLPFELKVTLTHLFNPENSKWNGGNSTSLRTQSDTHTSFTPENSKWNGGSKCRSSIFLTPKTQDGMGETQLPFKFKGAHRQGTHPEN
jgi:hypothetical protein